MVGLAGPGPRRMRQVEAEEGGSRVSGDGGGSWLGLGGDSGSVSCLL